MPLRAFKPSFSGNDLKRLVEFAGSVIFGFRPADDFDAGIEGDDRFGVAVFHGRRIPSRDGVVEVDMLVAAVKPPAGHLLPIPVGPFLDDLAPLLGEGQVDGLVLRALGKPKAFCARASSLGVWQGR